MKLSHLDQSNYLPNQNHWSLKYNLTRFIRLVPGLVPGSESCGHFQGPNNLPVDSLDSP
jgi:hypothetical protein